jgi:divalent metal cation (Fe/Co/Zn/Cd) transporter
VADEEITRRPNRDGPDMVTLIAGLLSIAIAGGVLLGFGGNLQWLLAVTAVGIGIGMLITSLRTRRDH